MLKCRCGRRGRGDGDDIPVEDDDIGEIIFSLVLIFRLCLVPPDEEDGETRPAGESGGDSCGDPMNRPFSLSMDDTPRRFVLGVLRIGDENPPAPPVVDDDDEDAGGIIIDELPSASSILCLLLLLLLSIPYVSSLTIDGVSTLCMV